ncbi:MAG: methyl-accepting chemotaxis protein [Deltaproteobacteria bacterium]
MNIRVQIGYKFILGFIAVVAAAAFVPGVIEKTEVAEWLQKPLSFLTAILLGLILGSIFTRGFTRRFSLLTSTTRRISQGELKEAGELNGSSRRIFKDETSDLEEAVSMMSRSLRALVEHIRDTVAKLSDTQAAFGEVVAKGQETSKEVIHGASRIFDGALAQANHIEVASSTVKAMAEIADDVANKVTDSSNSTQKVTSMVQRGTSTATSAMEKMETIFKGIENTEAAAVRLKEKLNDIPKILDVITHISRQTDLLALNATIEASKAGEHGRGFAMVAEEVRRFADNTNSSVQDVAFIVRELKAEVERVVSSASDGTSNLKGGREDLRKIREILVEITNYTAEVAERASSVIGLTHRQKEKAEKAVEVIGQVAGIARENLISTEKVDAAVERHGAAINDVIEESKKLSALSKELQGVISRFNL